MQLNKSPCTNQSLLLTCQVSYIDLFSDFFYKVNQAKSWHSADQFHVQVLFKTIKCYFEFTF